jgi:anti-sigma factor ChrR (cupin superfamily)
MKHLHLGHEEEELAALHALGALEPERAAAFERHLLEDGCETCRRQLEAMAGDCGELAHGVEPVPPPPAVRERVLGEAALRRPDDRGLVFAFADEGRWVEIQPGVFTKDLAPPRPGDRSRSYLVRMEPGSRLPRHSHECVEHCYVVSGSTIVGGRRMRAGDYSYAARGSVHEPIPSDEGALLFIVETG